MSRNQNLDNQLVFPEDDNYFLKNNRQTEARDKLIPVVTAGSKIHTNSKNKKYIDRNEETINISGNYFETERLRSVKRAVFGKWQSFSRKIAIHSTTVLLVLVVIAIVVVGVFVETWTTAPSLAAIIDKPAQSSIVYARDGKTKIWEFFQEEKREFVSISDTPRAMQLAVLALEDENFYYNEQGIPWKNILGAAQKCLTSGGDNCRGGSGIAQQLVKIMTRDNERTANRKIRELVYAMKLNQQRNHTDILEAYLNWAPFGRNAYGVQQASRSYFGKDINEVDENGNYTLNTAEACFLASLTNKPSYYEFGIANRESANWKELMFRKNFCLNKMKSLKFPSQTEPKLENFIQTNEELILQKNKEFIMANTALEKEGVRKNGNIPLTSKFTDNPFPHFKDYVSNELDRMISLGIISREMIYQGGLRIITTLDPEIHKNTEKTLVENQETIQNVNGNNAAALVLDGPTGQILAMVGSLDYENEEIDGQVNVMTTPQQPGSSIKPYVYANSWRNGYNPGTTLNDTPFSWKGFKPVNFSGKFNGNVTMRYALQNSLNIPAVKALLLGPLEDANNDFESSPNNSLERQLNGFFNFAEATGLQFPCIPSGDGNICNDPEQAKKAYRNRCFISTALGGCEVLPLSHATGINTILQEGNLSTATPFLQILGTDAKGNQVDIYKQYKDQLYPIKEAAIDPEIAKQTANVMTDYDIRRAEFGNIRFNLQLDNLDWKVAAKTGTSNGPKDFWLVGGSPYYTVAMWAGRTDNQDMDRNASSSVVISSIWKQIMEYAHKDKEVKNFSTEELKETNFNKKTELLTSKQIDELKEKGGRIEPQKPPEE